MNGPTGSTVRWEDSPEGRQWSAITGAYIDNRGRRSIHDSAQPEPLPLRPPAEPPEPFPVDALRGALGEAVRAIHEVTQAAVATCAQSVLAAASLAAQAVADVELPHGSVRPASLYLVTVAGSGERKTSADDLACRGVRDREAELRDVWEAERTSARNARDAWEAGRREAVGPKRKTAAEKRAALDELGPEPPMPRSPILTTADPTIEGLHRLYAEGWPSLGLFAGEGGVFTGGHAMSAEHRLRTAGALSELWDGSPMTRVRGGDGSSVLAGRRLAAHLAMQPGVGEGLLRDAAMVDQGLTSRLLCAWPEPLAGTRSYRDMLPQSRVAVDAWRSLLLDLLRSPAEIDERTGGLRPRLLRITGRARAVWIRWADAAERQVGEGGDLAGVRSLGSKLAEHAARLAAVLTVAADRAAREIPADAMAAGVALAQYYGRGAARAAEEGAVHPDVAQAERLLGWLRDWRAPLVSLSEILRLGPRPRAKAPAERAVRVLIDHGWLLDAGPGEVLGQRRRGTFRLVRGEG